MNDKPALPEPPEPSVSTKDEAAMGVPVAIAAAVIVGAAIGYASRHQDTVAASARTVTVTITEPASNWTAPIWIDRCDWTNL